MSLGSASRIEQLTSGPKPKRHAKRRSRWRTKRQRKGGPFTATPRPRRILPEAGGSGALVTSVRVRLVLNEGRHGAPLSKLGKIAEQLEKFLRALAADSNIDTKPGEWVAANFTNSSVAYDAEFLGDVNVGAAQVFARGLEALADYDPEGDGLNGMVSDGTALEYARIGALIDPDEHIGLGIYPVRGGTPKWRRITYSRMASLRRQMETPLPTHGAVQGILYSWFKEARSPSFQIRELASDALVRVHYPSNLYADVARAVQERNTMLIVAGEMSLDRATRLPVEMHAERIQRIGMLSAAEFEALVGSAPDYEADLSEETYWDAA